MDAGATVSATCKSCRAAIIWFKTPRGKAMCVDATPHPDGNVVIRDGLAVVLTLAELAEDPSVGQRRFMTHWATCPNSKSHKKPTERKP